MLSAFGRTLGFSQKEQQIAQAELTIQYLKEAYANQEEKGLLREIFEDILPASVAHRKKNPYPKTHSPVYTELACAKLKSVLADPHCRLQEIFDMQAIQQLLDSQGTSFKSPWYGQLMTGPQLISYLYTINQWLNEYHIILDD